jgi:MFS transporter, Spinster family, sphingosine-1-phosphate transporter
VSLLVPVALLNYMDRQMIAAMQTSVMKDLPDIGSDQRWGQMLAQFKWVYAFFSPFGGWIADRFGRRITICASLAAWSIITYLTGQAETFSQLLWTRTAMGVSEAFYIPAALAMISDYHTGETRGKAVGAHQMGIYCGVIAGGFAGYIADAPSLGWRWAFDITGIIGVLYAIPLFLLLRDAPSLKADQQATGALTHLGSLFKNTSFLLLVAYFTLPALSAWVVRDWMPKILQSSFNISQGKAGVSAALYWQVSAILAALVGGWLADRWMRRTQRGRIYVSALGVFFIVPALFLVGNAPEMKSLTLAIVGLVIFGIGWGWFDCNNMPILCQITQPAQRATGYGLMNFVSMSFGGVADIAFGWMRDHQVPLNWSFGAFALICLLSISLVLLIRPRVSDGL